MRARIFFTNVDGLLRHTIALKEVPELRAEDYHYVALMDAESPEGAFAKCQNLEKAWKEGERSMSCGDIVYMGDLFYLVRPVGFSVVEASEFTTRLYRMALKAELQPSA